MNIAVHPLEKRVLLSGSTGVAVAPLDLSVTLVTASPASNEALPGKSVHYTLEFFNNGTAAAKATATTLLSGTSSGVVISGTKIEHLSIPAGHHQIFHITEKIPVGSEPGTYDITANLNIVNKKDPTDIVTAVAEDPATFTVLDPYPNIDGVFDGTWVIKHGIGKGAVTTQVDTFFNENPTDGSFDFVGTNYFSTGGSAAIAGTGTITTSGVVRTIITGTTTTTRDRFKNGVLTGTFILSDRATGTLKYYFNG